MRPGAAVSNAFRHRIGLGPHDVLAQIPTVPPQGESKRPGNAHHVLGFEPVAGSHASGALLGSGVFGAAAGARSLPCPGRGVGVADDDPQSSVIGQHLANRAEYFNQIADVRAGRDLPPDLQVLVRMTVLQVAAQAEVRWTGHAHLYPHAVPVHSLQQLAAIPGVGAVEPAPCISGRPVHEDDPSVDEPVPVPSPALRW